MEKINKIFLICFVILCLPGILSFAENMENIDNNKLSSFRLSGGNVINYALEKTGYSLEELLIKLVSCGTRIIDIVFVLDTTGSMYADLASAQANCAWFVNQLDSAGFNYAFGLVTFGDNTNFPHGYDLTNDGSLFQSWLWALSAGGGGDWRESSLDGIADAINLYNWRPYANHVVVMLTDAPFHHIGESEYSDETPEGVLNLLIETNTISDIISPNTMSSPSVPAFDYNWYLTLAESSGGNWYLHGTSFSYVYEDLLLLYSMFDIITIKIFNMFGYTLDSINVQLFPMECITIAESPNPQSLGPVGSGDSVIFEWAIGFEEPCFHPEDCFYIRVWSDRYDDTVGGCLSYGFNCACSLSADTGPEQIYCYPDTVIVGNLPPTQCGVPPYRYFWSPSIGLSCSDCSNPSAFPDTTTTYKMTVWDCTDMIAYDSVIVFVSNILANAGSDTTVNPGELVILGTATTATGGFPPYSYTWIPENFLSDPTTCRPICIPESSITYVLEVIDSVGCLGFDTVTINVEPVGIIKEMETNETSFEVYSTPNYNVVYFSLKLGTNQNVSINIYNIIGQKITNLLENQYFGIGQYTFRWSGSDYPSGFYFAKIRLNNEIYVKKFMILK